MNLGESLRAARKAVGMTQADAASKSGVSRQTVVGLESGKGSIPNFHAVAAAVEFRIAGLPAGKTTGARIALARSKRKWTQAKLAEKAGISVPTVRSVERNAGQLSSLQAILVVISKEIRARKPEKANWTSGGRDRRYTPSWLLNEIVKSFGPICLDPCAGAGSAVKADRYVFEDEDGLTSKWSGRLAFMNPPYSAAAKWLERAYRAWAEDECRTVVGLVPVRTNSRAFLTMCAGVADVLFLPGRPNFVDPDKPVGVSGQTPFGVMLICWGVDDRAAVQGLASRLGARLMERDRLVA